MLFSRIQSKVGLTLEKVMPILNSNVVSNLVAACMGYLLTKSYKDDEITQVNRRLT